MWIASNHGFFSIVQKAPDEWHVRARVKRDLENLKKATPLLDGKIERWPSADYRYRIIVRDPEVIATLFLALANSIDYPNFKSEIAATPDQRDKLPAYHEIWHVMHDVQLRTEAQSKIQNPKSKIR